MGDSEERWIWEHNGDFGHGHMLLCVVSCSASLPEVSDTSVPPQRRQGKVQNGERRVWVRDLLWFQGLLWNARMRHLRGSQERGPQSTFPLMMSAGQAGRGKQSLSLVGCGPVGSAECWRGRREERPSSRALLGQSLPCVYL